MEGAGAVCPPIANCTSLLQLVTSPDRLPPGLIVNPKLHKPPANCCPGLITRFGVGCPM